MSSTEQLIVSYSSQRVLYDTISNPDYMRGTYKDDYYGLTLHAFYNQKMIRFSVAMMNTTAQDDRLLLNVRTTSMLPCAVLPCPTLCLLCSALPYVALHDRACTQSLYQLCYNFHKEESVVVWSK
ncbi:hypothetical protein E2C01_051050 [Portunus trituberculatus]|uniref:Uncharacterized protein n=1 Tax=Portunus trituberculatus TaxID=210409 RepID=A0A5B7GJ60_PORTR|nr:hypothetical protein [Portunus trituberculatus]